MANPWLEVAKGAFSVSKVAGGYMVRNWKGCLALGTAGYLGINHAVTGEGTLTPMVGMAFGDRAEDKFKKAGVAGLASEVAIGEAGEEKLKELAHSVKEGAGCAYDSTRSAIAGAGDYVKEHIGDVKEQVGGYGQQEEYFPEGYPAKAPYQPNPQAQSQFPSQYQSLSGVANPFSSIEMFVQSMTGGRASAMDLLGLVVAGYMMFGSRFGWIGKAGGALLGGITAKDMQKRSNRVQSSVRQYPQGGYYESQPQQPLPVSQPAPMPVVPDESDSYTVSRMRV